MGRQISLVKRNACGSDHPFARPPSGRFIVILRTATLRYLERTLSNTTLPFAEPSSWHLLDAGNVAVKEFGAALNRIVPVICWQPDFRWFPLFDDRVSSELVEDPPLQVFKFKLQRGYSRPLVGWLSRFADRTSATLRQASAGVGAPLICTAPFYAPVAQRWQGPVIYYLTDLAAAYDNLDSRQVVSLDRTLCSVATLVCPNSQRLASYLTTQAACEAEKISVVPNATRASSIREMSYYAPEEPPADLQDLSRPLVGVIGNLAGNLDWELIYRAILLTPTMSWVFVGPTSMKIACRSQRDARERVLGMRARVRFVGSKPYGMLYRYARTFDAAVLPYRKVEPTFSGSSTRFYEHLAACRPMLATKGVEELTRLEPMLRLVDGPEQLAEQLTALERNGFHDGLEGDRWLASHSATWDCRAEAVVRALRKPQKSLAATPFSAPFRDRLVHR
jgi:glycosyltransferase involved in cell wall biosynthesis